MAREDASGSGVVGGEGAAAAASRGGVSGQARVGVRRAGAAAAATDGAGSARAVVFHGAVLRTGGGLGASWNQRHTTAVL